MWEEGGGEEREERGERERWGREREDGGERGRWRREKRKRERGGGGDRERERLRDGKVLEGQTHLNNLTLAVNYI